jgi:HAD superfamily hydrolase (TIGR01509 family)
VQRRQAATQRSALEYRETTMVLSDTAFLASPSTPVRHRGHRSCCSTRPQAVNWLQRTRACAASSGRNPAFSAGTSQTAVLPLTRAILFDCDGVLADTERDGHRVAFNRAFREFRIDEEKATWDVNLYGQLLEVGGGKERMTAHFNEVGWPDVARTPDDQRELVQRLHKRKTEIFMKMVDAGEIPLRVGVASLIQRAFERSDMRVAVCSTSNEKAVQAIVNLLGPDIAPRIRVFAGDVVPRKKPAPDIYLLAIEQMRLDPNHTVVIEDSAIGVKAAKAAGLCCLVTKSAYTRFESFEGADAVIDALPKDGTEALRLLDQVLVARRAAKRF